MPSDAHCVLIPFPHICCANYLPPTFPYTSLACPHLYHYQHLMSASVLLQITYTAATIIPAFMLLTYAFPYTYLFVHDLYSSLHDVLPPAAVLSPCQYILVMDFLFATSPITIYTLLSTMSSSPPPSSYIYSHSLNSWINYILAFLTCTMLYALLFLATTYYKQRHTISCHVACYTSLHTPCPMTIPYCSPSAHCLVCTAVL